MLPRHFVFYSSLLDLWATKTHLQKSTEIIWRSLHLRVHITYALTLTHKIYLRCNRRAIRKEKVAHVFEDNSVLRNFMTEFLTISFSSSQKVITNSHCNSLHSLPFFWESRNLIPAFRTKSLNYPLMLKEDIFGSYPLFSFDYLISENSLVIFSCDSPYIINQHN
jgi:hypothetical protein